MAKLPSAIVGCYLDSRQHRPSFCPRRIADMNVIRYPEQPPDNLLTHVVMKQLVGHVPVKVADVDGAFRPRVEEAVFVTQATPATINPCQGTLPAVLAALVCPPVDDASVPLKVHFAPINTGDALLDNQPNGIQVDRVSHIAGCRWRNRGRCRAPAPPPRR